jgi:hypothetical protein
MYSVPIMPAAHRRHLLPAPGPRAVTMSSGVASYGRIRFDDRQWEPRLRPSRLTWCRPIAYIAVDLR